MDATWTPKKVPVFLKTNLTVEFIVTISVATPDASLPAWITKPLKVMLCKMNNTNPYPFTLPRQKYRFI